MSVVAVRVKAVLVNIALGAACLAKVACLLFSWCSQPVVLKTGWARQFAEWDQQQKNPKKDQDKEETPNKQQNPSSTFILVSARTVGRQDHILMSFS